MIGGQDEKPILKPVQQDVDGAQDARREGHDRENVERADEASQTETTQDVKAWSRPKIWSHRKAIA